MCFPGAQLKMIGASQRNPASEPNDSKLFTIAPLVYHSIQSHEKLRTINTNDTYEFRWIRQPDFLQSTPSWFMYHHSFHPLPFLGPVIFQHIPSPHLSCADACC